MDKQAELLYQQYLKLSQAEQHILQILAVMFEPRKQATFLEVIEALGWTDEDNVPLAHYVTKPWRDKWLDLSLITYNKYQLQCNILIIEALTWETVKNNTFNEIEAVVRRFFPFDNNADQILDYKRYQSRPYYDEAALRIALYRQDEATILDMLGSKDPLKTPPNKEQQTILLKISDRFLSTDPALFETLPKAIQVYLLSIPALDTLYNPTVINNTIKRANRFLPALAKTQKQAAYVLAEIYIFQGNLKDAYALVKNDTHSQALAIQGWITFLQGEQKLALQHYQAALAAFKKESRRHNLYLPKLAGIFYLIALLATDNRKEQALALQLLRNRQKAEPQDIHRYTLDQLDNTLEIQLGKRSLADVYYLISAHHSFTLIQRLLQTLQWLWTGNNIDATRRNQLLKDREKAASFKLDWLVWQLGSVLKKINQISPSFAIKQSLEIHPITDSNYCDLCGCLRKKEAWELALDMLDDIATPNTEESKEIITGAEMRMSWRISKHYDIEPREQKINKAGKWTLGRRVSLKKLYTERHNYDYLSDQDQRICDHIKENTYYDYGYYRTEYIMDMDKALLEAVGHPFVFLEDQLTTPIDIIKGEPRLEIIETKGDKTIKLQLIPYSDQSIAIHKESNNTLNIVEYTEQHQRIAEVLGKKGLTVPKKAKQQVMQRISQLAPLLTIHSDIALSNDAIETVEAQQTLIFHLQPIGEGLRFNAYIQPFTTKQPLFHAGEGGATVFTEIEQKQIQTHRDLKAEKKKYDNVLRHCPALYPNSQQEWLLDDSELALETLLQLQALDDEVVLEWPQGKKITLNHAIDMSQMSLSIHKSQDWFALSGELQISDRQVLEMRQLMDLLADTSGRFIRLGDNQFLALTKELRDRLDAIHAYTSDKGRFHPLAIPAIDELSEGMNLKVSKPWKDQLARLKDSRKIKPKPPSTLQAKLRDYQLEGFQWLSRLAHWGAGACLADDMGLGKTMQALALILTRCKKGPTLVLAPTSVCNNWETEAYRFAPTLKVKRFGTGDRQEMLDNAGAFDLIICSYGLLHTEAERLIAIKWHNIIADEAQAIKNYQAKRTKTAMKLQADFKIITTGTPIENHLGELWSLFQFINPGLLGSLDQFNQKYALPIERDNSHQARQQLKNLITPFILRRLKSDVLTELPPRTEITLKVTLSKEEQAFYEAIRQQAVENVADTENPGERRMKILAEIMRLRRSCCHPRLVIPDSPIASAKLEAFAEIIKDLQENKHKALVFSQFVGHLSLVREYLDQQKIDYQYLDGSTPNKKRQQAVNDFQAGDGDLFLISLKAGGSGLNLTAADYVIHLDPWWNPAVEDQASDRAHRIGQQRPVTIYRLVAENTIEEKIVSLHHQKRDLADSLLEGTEMSGKLSVEDILALLKEE